MKENKKIILQLGAIKRISLLQTDLFPVRVATLEIQVCVVTYYFICLETKPISFLLYPTNMDTKSSPEDVLKNRS